MMFYILYFNYNVLSIFLGSLARVELRNELKPLLAATRHLASRPNFWKQQIRLCVLPTCGY
jgi:hypothetical protein